MKIFALMAAMLIYFSVAMQNAVKVINYPNHGIQLPVVKVYASANAAVNAETARFPQSAIALN